MTRKLRPITWALAGALSSALMLVGSAAGPSAQQAGSRVCLHNPDETPEDADRRTAALALTRGVNTAQSAAASSRGRYVALEELASLPPIPEGFTAALSTDGRSYAFSLKDRLDPCRFVYFSDQDGVIYRGEPLQ
jgi:hypothetical protein